MSSITIWGIILIIVGTLSIWEDKTVNYLLYIISCILIYAVLIGIIGMNYIGYLIILIYVSALLILFGIIIMMDINYIKPTKDVENWLKISKGNIIYLFLLIIFLYKIWYISIDFIQLEIDAILGLNPAQLDNIIGKIGEYLYLSYMRIWNIIGILILLLLVLIGILIIL